MHIYIYIWTTCNCRYLREDFAKAHRCSRDGCSIRVLQAEGKTGDVGSKTVRKTSCISHVHVFLMVFVGWIWDISLPDFLTLSKKNIPFFWSPKEISPAVPMECAEHPIATPRTKGEDLAEHISTNQEGYRVSVVFQGLWRWFVIVIVLACGINHIIHPGMSFDIGTDSGMINVFSWRDATWRTATTHHHGM